MGISRSTYYYRPKGGRPSDIDITDRIEEIAFQYPSYGYKKDYCRTTPPGRLKVNHKRVLAANEEPKPAL